MSELDVQTDLVEDLLVSFLLEELGAAGFDRALVGLSGGIDSAVSAALAARAFGPENVLAVMMPHSTSNTDSLEHAKLVAEAYSLPTRTVEITGMVDAYFDQEKVTDATRRGNVMARARMTILYDHSVEWEGLVIGTSNKTEMLLGYSTQWGDGAHAVNPLGDLYKHQVVQLARHLGVPEPVIDKPPSADLFEGQTDEDDLGFTYAQADAVLWRMVDRRYSEAELIAEGYRQQLVQNIAKRIVRNQYKRVTPPIAKVSERSINHDFRYLRDWGS